VFAFGMLKITAFLYCEDAAICSLFGSVTNLANLYS